MDKLAIHSGKALSYLSDVGLSEKEAREVLTTCRHQRVFGADYYQVDGLSLAAWRYVNSKNKG